MHKRLALVLLAASTLLVAVPATAESSPPPIIGLGQPLAQAQIERYAITVFPDGRNLPPGQGSVA